LTGKSFNLDDLGHSEYGSLVGRHDMILPTKSQKVIDFEEENYPGIDLTLPRGITASAANPVRSCQTERR
jgi:hypothetical protein